MYRNHRDDRKQFIRYSADKYLMNCGTIIGVKYDTKDD